MNPAVLLKLKGYWSAFNSRHPKLMPYLTAVSRNAMAEGTVVDVKVTPPEGAPLSYNMRLNAEDIKAIEELRGQLGR